MNLFSFNRFLAVFLVCLSAEATKILDALKPVSARIYNGYDAKIEDFPFFASFGYCGAAILSEEWVVSAAHCFTPNFRNQNVKNYNRLFVGGETLKDSKRVCFDDIVFYPGIGYADSIIPVNDIALIHLEKPLKFSKRVNAVALPSVDQLEDPNHVFVGRGTDETGSPSRSLKKMDVIRLSAEECLSYVPEDFQEIVRPHLEFFEKVTVCTKRPDNIPGLCFGDSGSPLVQNNTLIGLASYIGKSCEESRLGFYVNVATYVPWIKEITGIE